MLGALLFAGVLAAADRSAIPGLMAGAAVRAAGATPRWAACWSEPGGGSTPARRGCSPSTRTLAALVLAAVAIFVEPVAYLALAAFVLLLVRGREQGERKYAGLRILR